MNARQFTALAKLMRLRDKPSKQAAYLHLVSGLRIVDAAREADCTSQAACNCVTRCKAAFKLAETATQ